jgi:hypothetical protein
MYSTDAWLVAGLMLILAVAEWAILRAVYRKRMAAVRARHLQMERSAVQFGQQAKRQIGQLQQELAAARLEAKHAAHARAEVRAAVAAASPAGKGKPAPSRPQLPVDGFADTLPLLQFGTEANQRLQ